MESVSWCQQSQITDTRGNNCASIAPCAFSERSAEQ